MPIPAIQPTGTAAPQAPGAPPAPVVAAPKAPAVAAEPGKAPVVTPKPAKPNWNAALGAQQKLLETQAELKTYKEQVAAFEALKTKFKTDPLGALADVGMDYGTVANAKIKASGLAPAPVAAAPAPETKALEEKVSGLEKKVTEKEQADQKAAETALQQQWNSYVADVDTAIKAEAAAYPMVNAFNATGLVIKEIEEHFEKTKKLITPAEAAKAVEDRMRTELQEVAKTNPALFKALTGVVAPAEAAEEPSRAAPSAARRQAPAKTLAAGTPPALIPAEQKAPPPAPRARPPSARNVAERGGFADFRAKKYGGS